MKSFICVVVVLFSLFWSGSVLAEDSLLLKNKKQISGVIVGENESEIALKIEGGVVKFSKAEIAEIFREGEEARKSRIEREKIVAEKGLVRFNGQWVTPEAREYLLGEETEEHARREKIANGVVWIGDTKDDVVKLRGAPKEVVDKITEFGKSEVWIYGKYVSMPDATFEGETEVPVQKITSEAYQDDSKMYINTRSITDWTTTPVTGVIEKDKFLVEQEIYFVGDNVVKVEDHSVEVFQKETDAMIRDFDRQVKKQEAVYHVH